VQILEELGWTSPYLHHILLSKQLYHLRHRELSFWWFQALNQQFSQLLLDPRGGSLVVNHQPVQQTSEKHRS
jgi:hypothetical protein